MSFKPTWPTRPPFRLIRVVYRQSEVCLYIFCTSLSPANYALQVY